MPYKDPEIRREKDRIRNQKPERKAARKVYKQRWLDKMRGSGYWTYNRRNYLSSKYGLTPEDYTKMYNDQKGICGNPACIRPAECVDHDHSIGIVRQLLCGQCNRALGLLQDKVGMLEGLAEYLRRHSNA